MDADAWSAKKPCVREAHDTRCTGTSNVCNAPMLSAMPSDTCCSMSLRHSSAFRATAERRLLADSRMTGSTRALQAQRQQCAVNFNTAAAATRSTVPRPGSATARAVQSAASQTHRCGRMADGENKHRRRTDSTAQYCSDHTTELMSSSTVWNAHTAHQRRANCKTHTELHSARGGPP
jgi:hypothetical protein